MLEGFNRFSGAFHLSGSTGSTLGLKETARTSFESLPSLASIYSPSWSTNDNPLFFLESFAVMIAQYTEAIEGVTYDFP
ncbi:hypothetical protein Tco_1575845 [Tanacetum coccineum]